MFLTPSHTTACTQVLVLVFASPIGSRCCRVWHYRQEGVGKKEDKKKRRKKKTDNVYLQQTSEPGWLTLMSAASQEVFQHSCLGTVGQTDRGFPANTHQTLAGPDWKPDTFSFLPSAISSFAHSALLLYVQGLVPQRHNTKAWLINHQHFFSFLLFFFFAVVVVYTLNLYSSILLTVFLTQWAQTNLSRIEIFKLNRVWSRQFC